jgi:hypothetical protein
MGFDLAAMPSRSLIGEALWRPTDLVGSVRGPQQPGGETRTLARLPEVVPGGGGVGSLTCGFLAPVVTARVRCTPLPAGSACTHRVPAGCGPVRSQTLRCSVLHDPRGSTALTPPVAVVPG